MPPKDKYTDPELRDQVKEELHAGDKGGAPGQWSARKAQMMASEYKKRGGDYNTDKSQKDASQKNLTKWGDEDWQTKEGSGNAKREDGTQQRYLPKKAWEKMSEEEKQATEDAKREGGEQGKQFVGNTETAKEKRKEAGEEAEKENGSGQQEEDGAEDDDDADVKNDKNQSKTDSGKKRSAQPAKKEKQEGTRKSPRNHQKDDSDSKKRKDTTPPDEAASEKKRKTTNSFSAKTEKKSPDDDKADAKKTKDSHAKDGKTTYGSKHQTPNAPHPPASAERLPRKGQKVTWKAMPGWVEGEVLEIVTTEKTVEGGKKVKGTERDPRIVLRSHGPSGKVAVHKPEAVFFE